ncbi:MAG TPA: fibronectin type III domain-containing protein [Methanomassiliicoccales archaeon]|nr:fibronectin type III domain-containing protein [Methanomassiliicoccales archaeon]
MKKLAVALLLMFFALAMAPMALAEETPGAPQNLQAERDGARIFISWEPPEGNVSVVLYNVYRGTEAGNLEFYDSLPGNFTAGYDTEVVRDRRYYYAVSANTTAGEGPMSEIVMVDIPSNDYPVMVMGIIMAVVVGTLIFAYWKGRGSERSP